MLDATPIPESQSERGGHELIWQCAWCGYVRNGPQAGRYLTDAEGHMQELRGATHGCCEDCTITVQRKIAMVRLRRAIAALETH